MDRNLKIALGIGLIVAVAVGVLMIRNSDDGRDGEVATAGGPETVEEDDGLLSPQARMLSEAEDGDVTVVEFLDFECPSCAQAYPVVEQLREEYGDRVTFAMRYLPLDMHPNAEPAAAAVEAAYQLDGQQAMIRMYQLMFENQDEWAGVDDTDDIFRGYAEAAGLDVARFDEVRESKRVRDVVETSRDGALELGIEGTPAIFVDGEQVEDGEQFQQLIDQALQE